MKNTISDEFKIIYYFKKPTKKNKKALEEAQKQLINILAYKLLDSFYEFIKKYEINLEDLAKGKTTIKDIKRKIEYKNVHNNLDKIILLIKDNPKITLDELATTIGKCKKTVQRAIASTNEIVRCGSARGGYWKVKE